MSNAKDRLKRLLDGDLEASDIAEDASLVSLADRLYGIKIANVKPVKARDMIAGEGGIDQPETQQFGQTSDMMVEVIEPAAMPLPQLDHLAMPDLPTKKKPFFNSINTFSGWFSVRDIKFIWAIFFIV